MKKLTKLNWQKISFAAFAVVAFLFAAQLNVAAQQKLKAGDRFADVNSYNGSVRRGTVIRPSISSDRDDCYEVRWDNSSVVERSCPWKDVTKFVKLDENDKPILDEAETTAEKNDKPSKEIPKNDERNRKAGGFQPGDRIEHQRGHTWYKGIVVANEVKSNSSYVIKLDEDPLSEVRVTASQVRALENPADDDGGKKVVAEATQQAEQARALCAGEPIVNPRTKGRAPSAALFGEVIRASFDKAAGNYDYKQVTKINSLNVGKAYRDVAIMVYPVKASLTTCEDAKSSWTIANRENYEFICYVDPARNGEWTCGIYKSGASETRIVPKPEANKVAPVRRQ